MSYRILVNKAIRQDAEAAAADLLDQAATVASKVTQCTCDCTWQCERPADEACSCPCTCGAADAAPVAYRPWGVDVLPQGVTMAAGTRVLSGPVKLMLDLYRRGLAQLNDEGDLVLQ